jgi:two-component system, cell cycle response regulator DivK
MEEIKSKVVLIVDNNPMSIFLLRMFISREKIAVISSKDALEAISICLKYPEIELVILDIELPVMNGIEATRKIKEYRKDLPVILHSTYSEYKDAATKCDCDEFIKETINEKMIHDLLKKYLE